jgi:hypothetical protein
MERQPNAFGIKSDQNSNQCGRPAVVKFYQINEVSRTSPEPAVSALRHSGETTTASFR